MQKEISQFIKEALKLEEDPSIEIPTQAGFGHYSSNVALLEAKKEAKNASELAKDFSKKLKEADKDQKFEKIESAGPGFINFSLSKDFLQSSLPTLNPEEKTEDGDAKTIIVEYSQPNIAKKMHVGHLRSTIIGDALSNILDYQGYKTIRWNFIGDWGTQFGKLIAAYKKWGSDKAIEKNPVEELLALYVKFHDQAKNDPSLEEEGRAEFKKLEQGDGENKKLWAWFKEESLKEFEKIYSRLGIHFDVTKGESAYEPELERIVRELQEGGIAKESQGALIVELEKEGIAPALIRKSDGATLYITRDIASLEERIEKYKPNKVLYVVANEQTLHFQQLFAIAERLGIKKTLLHHLKFGLMLAKEGKKLSTREGRVVDLEKLLNEAVSKAKAIVEKKNPDLNSQEKEKVAETVGLGALKYFDLKERRTQDISFDWEQMLDFNGNSAPYIQYSYARLQGILSKEKAPTRARPDRLSEEIELEVIKKLLDFKDIVNLCAQSYITSHLATYLYQLAKLSNKYYEEIRILDDEKKQRKEARLFLLQKISQTLKQGLSLLGIQVLEQI